MAGGMHGRGACMAGGVCGKGCAWLGGMRDRRHMWQGVHGRGACMAGGVCVAGKMATAADGTHPGMHSYFCNILPKTV